MATPKRILVPVDGSEGSLQALTEALEFAALSGASVTVFQVIEEFGPLPGKYEAAPPGHDRVKWLSDERFEKVREALEDTSVTWTRRVVEGYAAEAICHAAEDDYDLIVIGSRGLSGVQRFLLGSVSDRVVRHAPCSVWVVKTL